MVMNVKMKNVKVPTALAVDTRFSPCKQPLQRPPVHRIKWLKASYGHPPGTKAPCQMWFSGIEGVRLERTAAGGEVLCTIWGLDEFTGVSVEKSMSIFFSLVWSLQAWGFRKELLLSLPPSPGGGWLPARGSCRRIICILQAASGLRGTLFLSFFGGWATASHRLFFTL